ncbi:MAG TPA: hypothetical protein VEI29_09440, partial [Burkholderiaceae bacterium]|nr:hypothetical protein [Burkholderiaceae bacterium]
PRAIIAHARELLAQLERGQPMAGTQLDLFAPSRAQPTNEQPAQATQRAATTPQPPDRLRERLRQIEPDQLTPRAALELLYELQSLADSAHPESH